MQLKTKDGICCDYCGTTYKDEFQYLSFDFKSVSMLIGPVGSSQRPDPDTILGYPTIFSCDICTKCFDSFKKRIVDNYTKNMNKSRYMIACDWEGIKITGDHYYCEVSLVKVDLVGQPNICAKCEHKTFENGQPCQKCGGRDFVKIAKTSSTPRYVELNLCQSAYEHFIQKAQSVLQVAGQWTTAS